MSRRFACRLMLILLPLLLISFYLPQLYVSLLIPKVTLTTPAVISCREKIPLTGTVIAAESADLVCDLPYAIDTVSVAVGDTVTAGEPIALINRTQTLKTWTELLSLAEDYSAITALLPYEITDLAHMKDKLPSVLYAPASGTVIACSLQSGSILSPGISCLTVSDCSTLSAALSTDEQYAEKLAVGDTVYLRSIPEEDTVRTAVITEISPAAAEVLSGTSVKTVLSLTAAFPDAKGLRPGYSIYGYLFPGEPTEQMLIPLSAVFQEGKTEYVYCYQDGKLCKTEITTDGILSQSAIVTAGLKPDTILAADASGLKDGMRVTPADSTGQDAKGAA